MSKSTLAPTPAGLQHLPPTPTTNIHTKKSNKTYTHPSRVPKIYVGSIYRTYGSIRENGMCLKFLDKCTMQIHVYWCKILTYSTREVDQDASTRLSITHILFPFFYSKYSSLFKPLLYFMKKSLHGSMSKPMSSQQSYQY